MKPLRLPCAILIVYLISLAYWVILSTKSFSADIIGYKDLGYIFYHQGLTGYLTTGLHREPLYPLFCALAMRIEDISKFSFTQIMAGFSVLILMATQVLTYSILRKLQIRTWICSLTLLYLAISPVITNSAFHILPFCEIITYPLILAAIIAGYTGWEAIKQNDQNKAFCYGAFTGILFATITFVKAAFECISPVYMLFFLMASLKRNSSRRSLVCFLAAAAVLFYSPVVGYKCLNKIYNGNFAIADRGPNTIYGNVAHRTSPLSFRGYLADLTSVAGDDVCAKYFSAKECSFWSFHKSDELGANKSGEFFNRGLPAQAVTDKLLRLSKDLAWTHLPQYILLTATESLRGLFWEGTTDLISFHLIMAVITCIVLLYCGFTWGYLPDLMRQVQIIIFSFIFFYSFFDILPRHILPIVPLYLISLGYCLDSLMPLPSKY